jgi:hypothetical protein
MISKRIKVLRQKLDALLDSKSTFYLGLIERDLPSEAGVYLISARIDGQDIPYYVGRATSLSRRLYTNHLMGNQSTARLKKYMVESGEVSDLPAAKEFIRNNCSIRWVLEREYRNRGALEGFFTSVIFPKYGISPE